MTTRRTLIATGTAVLGVALATGAGTATAATNSGGPSATDATAARHVAGTQDTSTRLANFFVHLDQRNAGKLTSDTVSKAAAKAKAPKLVGAVHAVYSLNPAFVRGDANAPVSQYAYLAIGAKSATGQDASLWLTKGAHGWQVMNIISGSDEAAYPAKAATVFTEPQINAWYRLDGGTVTALNATAKSSVGDGVKLADYQRLVHGRYADKMAGSAYQRAGRFGGYQPTRPAHHNYVPGLAVLGVSGLVLTAALARRRLNGLR